MLTAIISCNINREKSSKEESKVDSNNLNDNAENSPSKKSADTVNKEITKDSGKKNDTGLGIKKAKRQFKDQIAALLNKGYRLIPINKWYHTYRSRFGHRQASKSFDRFHTKLNNKILQAKGKWGCFDANNQLRKIRIQSKMTVSAVIGNKKADADNEPTFKVTIFFFDSKKALNKEKSSLSCINDYITSTDGLKNPSEVVYQNDKATIISSRSALFFNKWGDSLINAFTTEN